MLCRYGVEYVEDPKDNKRIATVNRMQYTSVLADEDYKSAIKYAEPEQKAIYEIEAKEIDTIQKGILAISQREEPFDVFICYKETDNSGRRTPDSVLANELYHQLTGEGYKVFFSRITLEDKLGTAYEPYIFAALNSAKVMVVLGTKPDYFNAVWVRNEWSRFLALIKNGANKVLIPAYRDMDPYNLPEEFSHLQAQDMSKLGFMQDLIRGIEKIAKPVKPKYFQEQTTLQSGVNTASLLRRVFLFLEDGDFASADEYCEKVLDIDAECGEAYLGKLMASLKVRRREALSECANTFENNPNYQKALRFGDEKLKRELEGHLKDINDRNERTRLVAIYKKGENLFKSARTEEDYLAAADLFASIGEFEDSEERAKDCNSKANEVRFRCLYVDATDLMKNAESGEDFLKASKAFEKIKEYKDSDKLAKECAEKGETLNANAIYDAAVALMVGKKIKNYKTAAEKLEKIRGFKDAEQKIELCNKKIEHLKNTLSKAELARQEREEDETDAFKEKLPLIKKVALVVVPVLIIAILAATVLPMIDWSQTPTADNTSTSSSVSTGKSEGQTSSEATSSKEQPSSDSTSSKIPDEETKPSQDQTSSKPATKPSTNNTTDATKYVKYEIKNNGAVITYCYQSISGKVIIPSKLGGYPVTGIGDGAFGNCEALTSVTIPNSVTSIGDYAFSDCYGLTSVTIPNSVTSIGDSAFTFCDSLTSVTIPSSVTSIGDGAFAFCDSLTSVTIPNSVTSIGAQAFSGCGLASVTIPNSVTSISEYAFAGSDKLTSIKVDAGNPAYSSDSKGVLFNKNKTLLIKVPEGISGSYTIPNSVTSIGDSAFANCSNLTNVTIPNSVTSIGDSAFANCSNLTNVTIPNSVTSIGDYAFAFCDNFTSVTIPNSVTSIGDWAFLDCHNLEIVYL